MIQHLNTTANSNMIGNIYPFYINNSTMSEYYVYQITSPSLSDELIPYITFDKIGEKVPGSYVELELANINSKNLYSDSVKRCLKYKFTSGDIFKYCNRKVKNIEEAGYSFVYESLKTEPQVPEIKKNGENFPLIEMQNGTVLQKKVLIALRNSLRWIKYNFNPGNFIDILWTPKTFIKFEICGDENEIYIKPVNAYKLTDFDMKNPLSININSINYPKNKWTKEQIKSGEFNSDIRQLEWKSFDRTDND